MSSTGEQSIASATITSSWRGDQARLFVLSGHDDPAGVIANMGLRPTRWRLYFTSATMIAVVNSVVGGAAVALALGVAVDAKLGLAATGGGLVATASLLLMRRAEYRIHVNGASRTEALYPSPTSGRDGTAQAS
jgi:hypothetical protein